MFARLTALIAMLMFTGTSRADDADVTFADYYAQPSIGKVGIAFFTATSNSNDTIIGIASDCCAAVEMHRDERIGGVASMRRISEMMLKKNEPRHVQPDNKSGEHIMLIGLKEPLVAGDNVDITFTFSKAPAQRVTFPVGQPLKPADNDGVHDLH